MGKATDDGKAEGPSEADQEADALTKLAGAFGAEIVDDATGEVTAPAGNTLALFAGVGDVIDIATDPEAAQRAIVERMLGAESLDALFGVHEGGLSKDLVGRTVEVRGAAFSAYTTPPDPDGTVRQIPKVNIDAIDVTDGKPVDFVSTSPNIVTFVFQANRLGAFPFRARIGTAKSKRGNDVLKFERV